MIRETRSLPARGEAVEALGIAGLGFLAGRPDDLERFLSLSGLDPHALRASAGEPGFLAGVLDFLLGDEALLIAFAQSEGIPPGRIGAVVNTLERDD